jgi:hypothetical protein
MPRSLVICDAGLPSLIAAWSECVARAPVGPAGNANAGSPNAERSGSGREPGAVLALWPSVGASAGQDVDGASVESARVARWAEACSSGEVLRPVSVLDGAPEGVRETGALLACVLAAAERGIGRVVWPAVAPRGDVDRLATIHDRALLVGRLVSIDARALGLSESGVIVETPYASLSDAQLIDLALDMDVPPRLLGELGVSPSGKPMTKLSV